LYDGGTSRNEAVLVPVATEETIRVSGRGATCAVKSSSYQKACRRASSPAPMTARSSDGASKSTLKPERDVASATEEQADRAVTCDAALPRRPA
jgi:hypothetical protein